MKKDRGLVNRKPLSNAVKIEYHKTLDELSKETKIPKSKLLDEALELLFKRYNKPIIKSEENKNDNQQ